MKDKDIIAKVLRIGTFLSFSALVVTVVLQIITRFLIPGITLVWTEELSRFLFIYSVAFGAPLAMKNQEYVKVDVILELLPKKVRDILETLIQIGSIALFVIVFINSLEFIEIGTNQTSATLGIPMSVAYSSIGITSFLIVFYGIINLIKMLKVLGKRGDVS